MDKSRLAERIVSGDTTAFDTFFAENYQIVYRKAYRMLRSHEDAEDATQEAFLKTWQNRALWQMERGTFQAWFMTLCQNTFLDILKKRRCGKYQHYGLATERQLEAFHKTLDPATPEPVDILIVEEHITQIEDVLCAMPARNFRERFSWILRHFEGYSYQRIGQIMKITPNSARTHVYRCNQKLKKKLLKGGDRYGRKTQ